MARTFAIGDIHGDIDALERLLDELPRLKKTDTLVLLGDYLDRGPHSRKVIERVMALPGKTRAKVVALRGNHEDAWLRVVNGGWLEFVLPTGNGCLAALRSFRGGEPPKEEESPAREELESLFNGSFLPKEVVAWMSSLPFFYEDEHAIYVHAGLIGRNKVFLHPSETKPESAVLWCRDRAFFADYRGKLVVFGHTATDCLPQELSSYTPEDPTDLWAGPACVGLDTGAGRGGFLTAVELPARQVYESRS
jgi:serine/threonine protein phosphatase 1